MLTEQPLASPAASAAVNDLRSSNPSPSQAKATMPYPCPPDYRLLTQPIVTEEVRQIPVSSSRENLSLKDRQVPIFKRPQIPSVPRVGPLPPLDE